MVCAYLGDKRFNNVELIKRLVVSLDNLQIKGRFLFAFLFCTNLRDICGDECKGVMDAFLLSVYDKISSAKSVEHYITIDKWVYALCLGLRDIIKIDDALIANLIKFLEEELAQKSFSSMLPNLTKLISSYTENKTDAQSIKLRSLSDKLLDKEKAYKTPSLF